MMKNKILWVLIITLLLFAVSCEKSDKSTSHSNMQYEQFEDIEIPAGFNFETSINLTLEIHAPNKATVVVVGNDGVEYYKILTSDTEMVSRTFTIPATVTSLDFHYRNMVFADYTVSSLINNPELYLYNFEETVKKSFTKRGPGPLVVPILEGVIIEKDNSITAHWGYNNQFAETQTIQIGDKNKFTGPTLNNSTIDQGQPTEFSPGRHYDVFTTNHVRQGNDCITWSLYSSKRLTQRACANSSLFPTDDSDGDGVPDNEDDYPNNPDRAYNIYHPGEGNYGTLAFEDLWPDRGDYDFNDMVIRYNIKEVISATNDLVDIEFDLKLTAVGATKQNGFFIELPIPAEDVTILDASYPDLAKVNSGTDLAIIKVFNNTNDVVQLAGEFMNTIQELEHTPYVQITFTVQVNGSYDASESIYPAPYNPFITIDHDLTKEVHLPGLPPTANADNTYFNNENFDDATDLDAGYYYKTATGAPWAINVPQPIAHPIERVDIVKAYPKFGNWVATNGVSDKDWYLYPAEGMVYLEP